MGNLIGGGNGGIEDSKVEKVPLGKEERENLVACATNILKNEGDDEVLESIVEMLKALEMNADVRKELKNFKMNGIAVIRKTEKGNYDLKLLDTPTTNSLMMPDLKPGYLKLESQLNWDNQPTIHNEMILKKVFEFCPVNDLKNCRLVSKKWRDLSLTAWRRRAVLRTVKLLSSVCCEDDDEQERGFVKTASKFLVSPFQRYDLTYDDLDSSLPKVLKTKQKKMMILDFFSSSIQHLFIQCDDLDMMCSLLTKLPELRVLHLELDYLKLYHEYRSMISKGSECPLRDLQSAVTKLYELQMDIDSDDFNMNVKFPWKKIFESVPALKSLELKFWGYSPDVSDEIMQSLCEVRREGNLSTLELKELRVYPGWSARCIVGSEFPLQKLCIELERGVDDNPSTILELLEAHAETIEYIKCGIGSDEDTLLCLNGLIYFKCSELHQSPPPYLSWKVKLPNLKELVLRNDCVWAFHLLSSLDVPNLEKLSISSVEPESIVRQERDTIGLILESDDFMGSCLLPTLNEFICDAPVIFCLKELQILGKTMPNLTHLNIRLGDETFPILYELWPSLESLYLVADEDTYSFFNDYAITGSDFFGRQVSSSSSVPNITDLKSLREFVLKTLSDGFGNLRRPGTPCISDVSAIDGFLELPKLEILHLETVCDFSPNVMASLEDHVLELKISEPDLAYQADDEPGSIFACNASSY